MKVFISQSNYIPWRGFFDILSQVDIYVVYDSMQFTKNDWRNRNLINNNGSPSWLTIPCGKSISRSIDNVYPTKTDWYTKHEQTLRHCYSKSPFWSEYSPEIMSLYDSFEGLSLSEINIKIISHFINKFHFKCRIVRDDHVFQKQDLLQMEKTDRLVTLCKKLNASTYWSAPAARAYLQVEKFKSADIDVLFYDYPKYASYEGQSGSAELSILDVVFNTGRLLL